MSLDQAWSVWRDNRLSEDETFADEREDAELVILDQSPRTPLQAIMMLEVLAANVEAGARSDHRDVVALQHLKDFLGSLTPVTPTAQR